MRDGRVLSVFLVGVLVLPAVAHIGFSAVPGVASFVVVGGSMEPTVTRGSLVFVQETGEYGPGDVVTFVADERVVTHRIVTETDEGYVTRGDANTAADRWRVSERQVVGEVVLSIPLYGSLLSGVGTASGYTAAVVVVGGILLGLEIRHLYEELR